MSPLTAALSLLLCLPARAAEEAAKPEPELSPRQIYQQDGPAVVLIICSAGGETGELGSGSLIDAEGHVLTNAHVVVREETGKPWAKIHVYLKPAKVTGSPDKDLKNPLVARVARYDRKLDLALLELSSPASGAPVLPLGDSDAVSAGDPVVAIGHPEQGGLWTLTTGVVSTVVADLGGVAGKDAFQTDASINRGNSGGPLINRRGEMVGVNTSIARKAADGLAITSVNFAIKSDVARNWLAQAGEKLPVKEAAARREPAPAAAGLPSEAPAQAAPSAAASAEPQPAPPSEPPQEQSEQPATPVASTAPQAAPPSAGVSPEQPKPEPRPVAKAPGKPEIVTPAKPYKIEDVIQKEMAEMEDLEKEMRQGIEKRRAMEPSEAPEPPDMETPEP